MSHCTPCLLLEEKEQEEFEKEEQEKQSEVSEIDKSYEEVQFPSGENAPSVDTVQPESPSVVTEGETEIEP